MSEFGSALLYARVGPGTNGAGSAGTVRCDGWADARQLLLGPSAGPRHSPCREGGPQVAVRCVRSQGLDLENKDRDRAEGGFFVASQPGRLWRPLARACDGKAAMDDVQDRARFGWGAVDHPADRVSEVRAPPGDRAPTGDLRSPRR